MPVPTQADGKIMAPLSIPADKDPARAADEEARFGPLTQLASVSRTFGQVLPVETWHPPFCGEIDMRIAKDGTWFYQGSRIERPALVQLFSRLLRKDGDRYVLVTPVECVGIQVEDVPFIAAELLPVGEASAQSLTFRTNVGDDISVDAQHPLRFETGEADGLIPYVLVRGGLWARLTRSLTSELIAYGSTQDVDGQAMFGIASAGIFFAIAPATDG